MNERLEHALSTLLSSPITITHAQGVSGGCISDAQQVGWCDDAGETHRRFVKHNDESFLPNFQAEWDGLVRLREPGVIGVPQPIAVGVVDGRAWLVTEWIEQAPRGDRFYERFAADLARLHEVTLGTTIGLDYNNFLGAAPQVNSPSGSWVEFVAEQRIGFQIRWAVEQGLADGRLQADCGRIVASMDDLLAGRRDQTSLLHGDLWSGNYLCGEDGAPVIIDPAIHYGCREAELGMLRLFGSCGPEFYTAYQDAFPLPAGWQRRVNVYVLYHLLNHLNLFGSGYLGQCRSLAAEILRG